MKMFFDFPSPFTLLNMYMYKLYSILYMYYTNLILQQVSLDLIHSHPDCYVKLYVCKAFANVLDLAKAAFWEFNSQ